LPSSRQHLTFLGSLTQRALKAKVAVYSCPVDIGRTETKGTVLLHDAKELLEFSVGEEEGLQRVIESIVETGVRVVVTGGTFGDLAMHYLNRHNVVAVKIPSKFDLQRLCRVTGATASARLGPLSKEEMGHCDVVECVEMGGDRVTVFRQEDSTFDDQPSSHAGSGQLTPRHASKMASIVLRGSTLNFLDDVERALDDGVNVIKSLLSKDGRLIPGAGATEVALSHRLMEEAQVTSGLSQYAILKFAEALEIIPRTLAANAGLDVGVILARLHATLKSERSESGPRTFYGVDIESCNDILDAKGAAIVDVLFAKKSALHLATDAALSVLRVDSIIMSKPAGGPKSKTNPALDDD
jgi:T-complex protein 1 subunit theta